MKLLIGVSLFKIGRKNVSWCEIFSLYPTIRRIICFEPVKFCCYLIGCSGVDGVTVESVIKFIKLAYCFEQWDAIIAMLDPMIVLLQVQYMFETFDKRETVTLLKIITPRLFVLIVRKNRSKKSRERFKVDTNE